MKSTTHVMLLVQLAAVWFSITQQFEVQLAATLPNIPIAQLNALEALYYSTNGDSWRWLDTGITNPWNFSTPNPNPCFDKWQGITCNNQCSVTEQKPYCVVEELNLAGHGLNGTIPYSIGNLNTLTMLTLSTNPLLRGSIPDSIANMTSMQSLAISGSPLFNGTVIPNFFNAMPDLYLLDLSLNLLEGTFPSSIYSLKKLVYLDLGFNWLHGSLTYQLCNLTSIEYFFLPVNSFTGSLPDCLDQLQVLNTIELSSNYFTGSIPESLYHITALESIVIDHNHFHGNISSSITQLPSLLSIQVQHNSLSGVVPQLGGMKSLSVLALYFNHFHGPIPVNQSLALTVLSIGDNAFTGSTSSLNGSQWISLAIGSNYITGTIPQSTNSTRIVLTDTVIDRIISVSPILILPGIIQYLPQIANDTTSDCKYLSMDFSENLLTGRLPDWMFSTPYLLYFYVNGNQLTGTIPSIYQNYSILSALYLDNNMLTGSLPNTLVDYHKAFINLRFPNNMLTGTIPSLLLANNIELKEFAADNNQFIGKLPYIPYRNLTSLRQLTMSNNQLTGTIPLDYFQLQQLSTFAVSNNCLSGSLTRDICHAKYLQSLVLDGISSATTCRRKLFPQAAELTSFRLNKPIQGTIPACIFELQRLRDLYISGNELTGTIPNNITISTKLQNLRLSYNRLTGSIPDVIQDRSWNTLDLSYNKFRGSLKATLNAPLTTPTIQPTYSTLPPSFQSYGSIDTTDSVRANEDNEIHSNAIENNENYDLVDSGEGPTLYLDVNRLSGMIPISLRDMININILNANIFYCDLKRSQLPEHDPKSSSYRCASQTVYEAMFAFTWIFWIAIILLILIKLKYKNILQNVINPIRKMIHEWNRAFEIADSKSTTIDTQNTMPFRTAWRFFHDIRRYTLYLSLWCILFLMPLYRIMNIFASMFENKYVWEYSAIYMTGESVGGTLVVIFIGMLIIIYYLYGWKLSLDIQLPDELHDDHVTLIPVAKQKLSFRKKWIRKRNKFCTKLFTFITVLFVNISIMTLANIAYVVIVVYVNQNNAIGLAQFALAVIKVMWNEYAIWNILRWGKALTTKLFRPKTFLIHNMKIMTESTLSASDVTLIVICLLFNNILAPSISVAFVSPSCFYNALVAAEPITAYYSYCSTYIRFGTHAVCFQLSEDTTTFDPPFIYSFNCTSLLPVNYFVVYTYMAIVSGIVWPSITIIMKYFHQRWETQVKEMEQTLEEDNKMVHSSGMDVNGKEYKAQLKAAIKMEKEIKTKQSRMKFIENNILSGTMAPLYAHPSLLCKDVSNHFEEGTKEFSASLKIMPPIFNRNRCIVSIVSFLVLLFSFGVVFPPLGVVMAMPICTMTYLEQLNIGKMLLDSEQMDYGWYREKLGYDLTGLVESMISTVFPMTIVASLLFGALVFDTIGDQGYFTHAIVASVLMILAPSVLLIILRTYTMMSLSNRKKDDNTKSDCDQEVIEMRPTETVNNPIR